MEKDGWQIAFLSTSRHHLHPAKICQPSQSSVSRHRHLLFSRSFFLIIEYLFVRHLVFVFQSKFFFNIPV